jgi:adenylate cyclase
VAEEVLTDLDSFAAIEMAFCQSVETANDPAEYQAYLDRYPDGAFAALVAERVQKSPPPTAADRLTEIEFWDSVKHADQTKMVEANLEKYPKVSLNSCRAAYSALSARRSFKVSR